MSERPTVAVLGLSGIGASLALALKGTGRFAQVVAWDPDFDVARRAQKAGVADRYARQAQEAVRQAAGVFIAVGPDQLRDTFTAIAPGLPPGAVVCGMTENQEHAGALAQEILPEQVSFVAAHPVLWERRGADDPPSIGHFHRGVLCIAPLPNAHPDAVAYLSSLADTLQMEPFYVDAREHDAFFAGIGRLPAILAAAYLNVVGRAGSWRELGRIAGGEFRQLGLLTDDRPADAQQGLGASRDHLVRWLDQLIGELTTLRDGLQDGQEPPDFHATANDLWRKWLRARQLPAAEAELPPPPAIPRRRFPF
jgi:prephenate dehydrogenase